MDSVFIKSTIVHAPTIYGVKLQPFSCWHALVLMQLDNPYIVGGDTDGDALLQALLVCQDRWHVDHTKRLVKLRKFTRSRWERFKTGCWLATHKDMHIRAEFEVYLETFLDGPSFWQSKEQEKTSIAWPFHIVGVLLTHFPCITEERAWNMPLNLAACYRACVAEENGMKLADEQIKEMHQAEIKVAK